MSHKTVRRKETTHDSIGAAADAPPGNTTYHNRDVHRQTCAAHPCDLRVCIPGNCGRQTPELATIAMSCGLSWGSIAGSAVRICMRVLGPAAYDLGGGALVSTGSQMVWADGDARVAMKEAYAGKPPTLEVWGWTVDPHEPVAALSRGGQSFSVVRRATLRTLFCRWPVAELKGRRSNCSLLCSVLFISRWGRCDSGANRALYELDSVQC